MEIDNQELPSTKAFKPGFALRLDNILEALGVRYHGRMTRAAEWSGLSVAGARKIFNDDRPPKEKAFEKICNSIQSEAVKRGKHVEQETISNYLLYGGRNPLTQLQVSNSFKKLDLLGQASIHIALSDAGKSQGINIFTDITRTQLEYLLNKLSEIHIEKKIEFNSAEMRDIAASLLTLSKRDILL